jgi:hypothetical protein
MPKSHHMPPRPLRKKSKGLNKCPPKPFPFGSTTGCVAFFFSASGASFRCGSDPERHISFLVLVLGEGEGEGEGDGGMWREQKGREGRRLLRLACTSRGISRVGDSEWRCPPWV